MQWEIFERVYDSHWFLFGPHALGIVCDFPNLGGGKFINKVIYIIEKGLCSLVFNTKEFDRAAHFTAERLINDQKWRQDIYRKIDFYTKQYFEAGEKFRKLPISSLTNEEIIKTIQKIIFLQHQHLIYSILVNGVIIDGRNHLSNKIRQEVQMILSYPKNFEKYWSILTCVPKMSLRQKKEYEISLLAKQVKTMTKKEIEEKLKKLYRRYCWLDYNNLGPAASFEQFKEELEMAAKNNKNLNLSKQIKALEKKQKRLMDKLKMNKRSRFLIKLAQNVIWQKGYRKDVQYHGFYCYETLFRELARRKGVFDWQVLTYLFPWEIETFVFKNTPSLNELLERRKYSCLIVTRKNAIIKTGKIARIFVKKLKLTKGFSAIKKTKGQCAYAGKARGRVKIIQTPADINKMTSGNILISQATSPNLLPAMRKAAAIVTNTGGLICHAAIVSRELKIPCIVGTTNATLIFKDGDEVEVDANKGIVKKL